MHQHPQSRRHDSMVSEPLRHEDNKHSNNCSFDGTTIEFTYSYGISNTCYSSGIVTTHNDDLIKDLYFSNNHHEPAFENPTKTNPIRASEFLSHLDLQTIMPRIFKTYGNPKHLILFEPEAMFKAVIFKFIKGIQANTDLAKHLAFDSEDADFLGFNPGVTPSHQTITNFIGKRLDVEGLRDIFSILVRTIKDELDAQGISFGESVSIDSTPLKGRKKDPEADYSGYYKIRGYKIHNVVDTELNIPLALTVTTASKSDGKQLIPLLSCVYDLDIKFKKVLADGAYGSKENLRDLFLKFGADPVVKLKKNAKITKGAEERVEKAYLKYWNEDEYNERAEWDEKLRLLSEWKKEQVLGPCIRNKLIEKWQENPDFMKLEYSKRTGIERFHGHLKEHLYLEKHYTGRGIEETERHVLLCYITILCVALCRIQHGITDDLIHVKCLA